MITLFSMPKAFDGHIGIIQRNAILSWTHLKNKPTIILLGNDPGVKEICDELSLIHVPDVKCDTNSNIPLMNDLIEMGKKHSNTPMVGLVNSDIILFDDFMDAIDIVANKFQKFLMVSSRWNQDINNLIQFNEETKNQLRFKSIADHDMYPAGGTDFFVFPKNCLNSIPPFLIGRGYWDNYLMYLCKKEGGVLVDTTHDVVALHQNHDYGHIAKQFEGDTDLNSILKTTQAAYNFSLTGGNKAIFNNYDADYVLKNNQLISTFHPTFIFRRLKSNIRRLRDMVNKIVA
jgi:hypothetical protein